MQVIPAQTRITFFVHGQAIAVSGNVEVKSAVLRTNSDIARPLSSLKFSFQDLDYSD